MKTMRLGLITSLFVLSGLGTLACERRTDTPKEPTRMPPQGPLGPSSMQESTRTNAERVEAGRPVAAGGNESAVSAITRARCDREARCNNVGSGKKYESRDDCVTKTRSDWRDDLNARECPQGVVGTQLASCVDQIKNESCGNVVEKLESVLACRTVDLCQRT